MYLIYVLIIFEFMYFHIFNLCNEFMYLLYLNCIYYFLIYAFIIFEFKYLLLLNSCIYYI